MTCKDCYHYKTCAVTNAFKNENSGFAAACGDFKDESLIVELPCKVGDTYYTVERHCSEGNHLNRKYYYPTDDDCEYCRLDYDKEIAVVPHTWESIIQILLFRNNIGKFYFLSCEEAEKRLEELKGGDFK